MKIECLKPGTDITIDASDGTKNLSFASSVLEVTENDREYLKQVCDEGFGLERGMHLEVQFKTKIGWSAQPTLFRLEGTVLRVIPAGKSRVNVGCRLTRADANLGKFIATKQREMLTTARNKKN